MRSCMAVYQCGWDLILAAVLQRIGVSGGAGGLTKVRGEVDSSLVLRGDQNLRRWMVIVGAES
jgi:hypothetical protein